MEMTDSRTDAEIVALSLEDRETFSIIVDRYAEKLRRYIFRLGVRTQEDQDDVLQDVFIKVYKNLQAYDQNLQFSSWIYRIAHNEAISWFRKRDVRPEGHLVNEGDEVLALVATEIADTDAATNEVLNAEQLSEALAAIDMRYREVLILRFFEHKEYDEISDILKIPTGSVGTLIHRGKQKLKALLAEKMLA